MQESEDIESIIEINVETKLEASIVAKSEKKEPGTIMEYSVDIILEMNNTIQ